MRVCDVDGAAGSGKVESDNSEERKMIMKVTEPAQ